MILKIKKIKGHAGDVRVLGYIASGADQNAPMFTNMAGSNVAELVREIAALRSLRPNLNMAGAHLILAHDKNQRSLSEEKWGEALDIALAEHGAQDAPFAAWPHDDGQHLHVYLLRIRSDGSVVSDSNSYRKNARAARAIEQHLNLDAPRTRAPEDRWPRASGAKAERGRRRFERLHASQTKTQPPQKGPLKVINPHTIFTTLDEAKGLDDLRDRLRKKGIESELVQAPGASEATGWRLREVGPAGSWLKGSEVHRDLSLKKVRERLDEPRQRQRRGPFEVDDRRRDSRQGLSRSGGNLMSVLVGLSFAAAIYIVGGFINLLARFLARKAEVPAESLGSIHVAEDGTPTFIEPVDLPTDAPADQHARLDAARTVMTKVLDQTAEAIKEDDTSLLPTLNDPEVIQERARVIEQLEEIQGDDDQDDEPYERECPR